MTTNDPCKDLFKKAMASLDFAEWVASEIFEGDGWEENMWSFSELACRKLEKLGIVKAVNGEWIYKEERRWGINETDN